MSEIKEITHKSYRFGMLPDLTVADMDRLIQALKRPQRTKKRLLGGRGMLSQVDLETVGPVVIKHYKRGGIWGWVNRYYYLHLGENRPQSEFNVLCRVAAAGIRVPEPVAYITEGDFIYRGWLVTRLVPEHRNLAELSLEDPQKTRDFLVELGKIIRQLIELGIYHIDLHPGNVIVDGEDKVYLLDFDKSRDYKKSKNDLRDAYLCRWRRAVIKHGLPELLAEFMTAELRHNFKCYQGE